MSDSSFHSYSRFESAFPKMRLPARQPFHPQNAPIPFSRRMPHARGAVRQRNGAEAGRKQTGDLPRRALRRHATAAHLPERPAPVLSRQRLPHAAPAAAAPLRAGAAACRPSSEGGEGVSPAKLPAAYESAILRPIRKRNSGHPAEEGGRKSHDRPFPGKNDFATRRTAPASAPANRKDTVPRIVQKSFGAGRISSGTAGCRFHTSRSRRNARFSVYCVPPGEPSYQATSSAACAARKSLRTA